MLLKTARGLVLLAIIVSSTACKNQTFFPGLQARAAIKNLTKQHAAAEIESDETFRSRISSLQQLGIMGEKIAESKADVCYIESRDAGFTIASWEQYCYLYFVSGYNTLLSRDETFDRIEAAALQKEDPAFPKGLRAASRRGCEYSGSGPYDIFYVPANSIFENDFCRIPQPVSGMRPVGARRPVSTKSDYTFDPEVIDQSVDLLWITYRHSYYREDLGCAGLFCLKSPRRTPIQAD